MTCQRWFYSPGWRQQPVAGPESTSPQVWMSLGKVPEALISASCSRGDRHVDATDRIRPGDETDVANISSGEWRVAGSDSDRLDLGRRRFLSPHRRRSITAAPGRWKPSGRSRLHGGNRKPLTVHFLTREFHDVLGSERAQPQWSFLLGSCLVATQEYPGIRCRQLDLAIPAMTAWRKRSWRNASRPMPNPASPGGAVGAGCVTTRRCRWNECSTAAARGRRLSDHRRSRTGGPVVRGTPRPQGEGKGGAGRA